MTATLRRLFALAVIAVSGSASAGVYTLVSDFPGSEANSTGVIAINDAGMIGGSYVTADLVTHGFVGSLGGPYTSFDYVAVGFNTVYTQVRALDNAGNAVGFAWDDNNVMRQFLRSAGGVVTTIVDPTTGNPLDGIGQGINDAGVIVGSFRDPSLRHGYIRSADGLTLTTLIDPTSIGSTNARGINSAGTVVGFSFDAVGQAQGFLYSLGAYSNFNNPLGVLGTVLQDINDNGDITGAYTDAGGMSHGFVYEAATSLFTTLDAPGATNTSGWQFNNLGQVVLTSDVGSYIWSPTAVVPEPGSLALVGLSLLGLGFMRRRSAA